LATCFLATIENLFNLIAIAFCLTPRIVNPPVYQTT